MCTPLRSPASRTLAFRRNQRHCPSEKMVKSVYLGVHAEHLGDNDNQYMHMHAHVARSYGVLPSRLALISRISVGFTKIIAAHRTLPVVRCHDHAQFDLISATHLISARPVAMRVVIA